MLFAVVLAAAASMTPLPAATSPQQARASETANDVGGAKDSGAPQAQSPSGAAVPSRAQEEPAQQTPAPTTVVVLDPAHGGSDPGARGPSGAVESELTLDFARAIRTTLQAQGWRVLLTREGNQNPSFDDRSAMVNGLTGAVFISLHVSSTGPVGTARVYWYPLSANAEAAPTAAVPSGTSATNAAPRPVAVAAANPKLVEWEQAQQSYVDWSRRLAELLQIQLAQKFQGSPETPQEAPVRQLRSIAAPAVAVEVSSVDVPDVQQLEQMAQPLADAVARAVSDFRGMLGGAGATPSGGR
jgi:N-acetylmuramoyl-L-alanine amidase